MFKKICVLTTATVLGFSAAHAEEFNLNPVNNENTELIQKVSDFIENDQPARTAIRTYKYINHIDLRDVLEFDAELAKKLPDASDRLPGTSKKILQAVSENTARFTGDLINSNGKLRIQPSGNVRYYKKGARGPIGHIGTVNVGSTSNPDIRENGFVIDKRYPHTYNNTLFSVDYISAKEVAPSVIEAKLLLYITEPENKRGDFFRRLTVKVDWEKNKTHGIEDVVSIVDVEDDIPLSATDFKLSGSLSTQKVILEDAKFGLVKIFPVTVGSIDVRDGVVESMNFWVPDDNRSRAKSEELKKEFQDFSNAALIKRSTWKSSRAWANTHERVYPNDYKGRPFLGLIDLNYVQDGKYANGYREIGIHYQITSDRLERGFRSHGCNRMRDKDLYQLDNIVNKSTKPMVKAVFKKTLPDYKELSHPHKREKYAGQVMYTKFKSEQTNVLCKINPDKFRSVRWNSSDKIYHTVIGSDCLTRVQKSNTGLLTSDVNRYWSGENVRVSKFVVNVDHAPILKAKQTLSKYYGTEAINSMTHRERLVLLKDIKEGRVQAVAQQQTDPQINDRTSLDQINGSQNSKSARKRIWSRHGFKIIEPLSSTKFKALKKKRNQGKRLSRKDVRKYVQYSYYYNCVEPSNPNTKWCSETEVRMRGY